jgi:hypothetical protein
MQTTTEQKYIGRVKMPDGRLSGDYVDWFTDDDAALSGYRSIMEEQGYEVKSVTLDGNQATVEIIY